MPKNVSLRQHSLEQPYKETVITDLKENLKMSYTERHEMMIIISEFVLQALKSQGIKPFEEKGKYHRGTQVISLLSHQVSK
jgi:D-Tyr-tRNAtyr deacylase